MPKRKPLLPAMSRDEIVAVWRALVKPNPKACFAASPDQPCASEHHIVTETIATLRAEFNNMCEEDKARIREVLTKESRMDGTTVVEKPPEKPTLTIAEAAQKLIMLRDRKTEIKEAHKKQLEPYNNVLSQLEAWILNRLNQEGLDNAKATGGGLVYKQTTTSTSVKEWEATLAFIREHELWDLLEARVSKLAAIEHIEKIGHPIPGVNVSQMVVLHVRRS
jgi:replicative superfamily II helicase